MSLQVREHVPLAQYTTLHVGGVADYVVEVDTVERLVEALQFAKQTAAPPLILGGGSNVLISDDGYRGVVILNKIHGISFTERDDSVVLTAGAGEQLDTVVAESVQKGYWGLENLSAIPGTVGATPIQNVGAYGVEVSSLITNVAAIHRETLEQKTFTKAECAFGYRDSFFKTDEGRAWVVTSVEFQLSRSAVPILEYGGLVDLQLKETLTPLDVRATVMEIRAGKFPDWTEVGTAGSFFKNPIITNEQFAAVQQMYPDVPGFPVGADHTKVPLGWVLDQVCGLRGYGEAGVCLYEEQALVLVAERGVSAKAIDDFADTVAKIVEEKTNIKIEREVRRVW